MKNNKKRVIFLLITIISFLGLSLGAVYYIYNVSDIRTGGLATGLISIDFLEGSNIININNTLPVIDEVGLENDPYNFTIANTSRIPINAKIQLLIDNITTLHLGAVKYAFFVNDELLTIDNLSNMDEDGTLYVYEHFNVGETLNCKLIFWIDYYYENPNEIFSAKVKVTGESFDFLIKDLKTNLIKSIEEKASGNCPVLVSENDTNYISGNKECIDFNYVSYSGKLWRIVTINSDGTMKMITDDIITTMKYNNGANNNFYTNENTKSDVYQWLNEDFLDTLYNYEHIIEVNSSWNFTQTSDIATINATSTTPALVGLLNTYEYYKSYQNTTNSAGYLNNENNWWLLNSFSSAHNWYVSNSGLPTHTDFTTVFGIRPSINLKSGIYFSSGIGTENDPYKIVASVN